MKNESELKQNFFDQEKAKILQKYPHYLVTVEAIDGDKMTKATQAMRARVGQQRQSALNTQSPVPRSIDTNDIVSADTQLQRTAFVTPKDKNVDKGKQQTGDAKQMLTPKQFRVTRPKRQRLVIERRASQSLMEVCDEFEKIMQKYPNYLLTEEDTKNEEFRQVTMQEFVQAGQNGSQKSETDYFMTQLAQDSSIDSDFERRQQQMRNPRHELKIVQANRFVSPVLIHRVIRQKNEETEKRKKILEIQNYVERLALNAQKAGRFMYVDFQNEKEDGSLRDYDLSPTLRGQILGAGNTGAAGNSAVGSGLVGSVHSFTGGSKDQPGGEGLEESTQARMSTSFIEKEEFYKKKEEWVLNNFKEHISRIRENQSLVRQYKLKLQMQREEKKRQRQLKQQNRFRMQLGGEGDLEQPSPVKSKQSTFLTSIKQKEAKPSNKVVSQIVLTKDNNSVPPSSAKIDSTQRSTKPLSFLQNVLDQAMQNESQESKALHFVKVTENIKRNTLAGISRDQKVHQHRRQRLRQNISVADPTMFTDGNNQDQHNNKRFNKSDYQENAHGKRNSDPFDYSQIIRSIQKRALGLHQSNQAINSSFEEVRLKIQHKQDEIINDFERYKAPTRVKNKLKKDFRSILSLCDDTTQV